MAGDGVGRQPLVITAVDDAVLRAVYAFPFLTAEQLVKLRYSGGSLTYARDRLKRLVDAGYLQRCHAPSYTPRGKAPFAYRLSRKGVLYCLEQGLDSATMPHRARDIDISYPALCHASAINEVLIAATTLAGQVDSLRLDDIQHEQQIKRKGQSVQVSKHNGDELQYVLPDGWLDFRVPTPEGKLERFPLWLEVDRDTEGVKAFKRKVRGILSYYDAGHYKAHFGTHFVTFAFAVDTTAFANTEYAGKRLKDIIRWIEEELQAGQRPGDADYFAIGLLPRPEALDPVALFLRRTWFQPFSAAPISLVDLPEPVRRETPSEPSKTLGVSIP